MSGNVRFNAMFFLPYIHLPENQKDFKSLWVDFSNKYYDPAKGHELYNRYLSELVLADRLGFDAIVINEHHNTVYSMMATPNLIAAAIIPQTKNAKICVWGVPPNFMLPNRLAEEYAILDVMSGGRLEIAAELGFGYSSVFVTQQRAADLNAKLRERAAHYGHTMRPDQFPLLTYIYVAETQEEADREYAEHLRAFFEDYARGAPYIAPPGYLTIEQLKIRAASADKMHGGFDYDAISKSFFLAVGTPEKVANQIGEWAHRMQTSHFNNVMHVADMPHWKTVKNMTLFTEEVIPRVRGTAVPAGSTKG
jgi:alkanesulfonate monooxygenase SsuD/methylene tetrahydromethanopterin reductase-like flavin-dependent oxidoreductase (luciferase family)